MSKILTIFGATGIQGGSVVNAVLADKVLSRGFKIRAITRDASKPQALALKNRGLDVVVADLSSPETVTAAVSGSHTVFLVTNFWELMSKEQEIHQGKVVTDACVIAGVQHLIFSSLINVTTASGGRLTHVRHFDSKAAIEQYVRQSHISATFVLAGAYMSNYFDAIRQNNDGSYAMAMPISGHKAQIPLLDALGDTGKFVKAAMKNFPRYVGKHILAASEYYTPDRLMSEFSEVIGRDASFVQVSPEAAKDLFPAARAEEMVDNLLLLEDPGYFAGEPLEESLALLDERPSSWKAFAVENVDKWL
ncbi:unnamed protein product [Clonostachys byssicola]|uniref:NmrA-like domain-containing protein n=1 Tax=Clonostachys byssicola TaxID=160290 RepID=A0A9N9V003_9HYPO|nr:unnamed protein product [Clonostachys byssicola]